ARAVESWPGADVVLELADAARAAGQPDLELGALTFVPTDRRDMDRFRALALATADPWFAALAEEQAADADRQQGLPARALERLRPLEQRCASADRVEDHCLAVELGVARAAAELLLGRRARDAQLRALAIARAEGPWPAELRLLREVGQMEGLRGDLALTHAYLEEVLARAPDSCDTAEHARASLALAHQRALDFAESRRQLDLLSACDRPPSLLRMSALADLQRSFPKSGDERALQRGIGIARADLTLSAGGQALITQLSGRAAMEHDRSRGERLLRQAISESAAVTAPDRFARRARLASYASLLLDAGKRGDSPGALRLFAEEGRWAAPPPCSLWLAADGERLLAISMDPAGKVLGQYDGARRAPAAASGRDLVPPELGAAVRACPEVKVIARPPLEGLPDLLPPDVAWSQALRGDPPPPAPGQGEHLVIAAPEPPAVLGLPALRGAPPPAPEQVRLEGAAATPSGALEAMRRASVVEVHAHAALAPEVADASYLALSPEPSGRFALTAAEVRQETLANHPVVLLASCRAEDALGEGHGLARAFLEAGARAVLAAAAPVPDQESGPFFGPLLDRLQAGASPAAALRDARARWRRAHGPGWVDSVVLFE
ncbi:MAG TPA: CHAT domain-containing protein, partial [Myxococcales bacterium]|nr:CHAT domain-containing protein [Myxococcales bacterium]